MRTWLARVLPVVAVLAGAAAFPVAAVWHAADRHVMLDMTVHIYAVGAAGAIAAVAAAVMSTVAARRRDGRGVLLGIAFSVNATFLLFHGLATPGFLMEMNGLVQLAGVLNLPITGAILALGALPALRRPQHVDRLLVIQRAVLAALLGLGVTLMLRPQLIPALPEVGTTPAHVVFAIGGPLLLLLAWRAARTYLLTRRTSDLLVAVGVVFLLVAEFALLNWGVMTMPWLLAHGLEIAGIALVAIPAALDLRSASASRALVGDLRAEALVADEEQFLGARVRALMVTLAGKDPSTAGHTRRVSTLAVQIGERLGLPEGRLRRLALGGLLHDMGKLSVPPEILTKPGTLTDDEFAVIKKHPGWGRELLAELGGFPSLVLQLVESHHERLDGAGYPHGVGAADLPLEVRVLTVADVFDALTADRVYRAAWPVERALALLDEETGTAFDARCVTALRAVVGAEAPAVEPAPVLVPRVATA
jgi:hypothetical protein